MLLSTRNLSLGKDGQLQTVGDVSNAGSPVQVGSAVLPRVDADMLIKVWPFMHLELSKLIICKHNVLPLSI